ncbi:hypothetical protein TKK_0010853 [Trichogramma kaykai]|uniref:MYND-type domain-containing protein n=1 Tax=Trichogramma kaykai TaxID=54128 RepID=A0ABD2WW92_9HYME
MEIERERELITAELQKSYARIFAKSKPCHVQAKSELKAQRSFDKAKKFYNKIKDDTMLKFSAWQQKVYNHLGMALAAAPILSTLQRDIFVYRINVNFKFQQYLDSMRDIKYVKKHFDQFLLDEAFKKEFLELEKKIALVYYDSYLLQENQNVDNLPPLEVRQQHAINYIDTKLRVKDDACPSYEWDTIEAMSLKDHRENVYLGFDLRYGRHLLAARDIQPGEVVLVDTPYAYSPANYRFYVCSYCMKISRCCVTCNGCDQVVYCSERCSNWAWDAYHDIECQLKPAYVKVLEFLKLPSAVSNFTWDTLAIRGLIKACRQSTVDMREFIDRLEKVDYEVDNCKKGCRPDGKFDSKDFHSYFSLRSNVKDGELKSIVTFSTIALLCLAKFTTFITDVTGLRCETTKLRDYPDAVNLGAILLRLAKVNRYHAHNVINPSHWCKNSLKKPYYCSDSYKCSYGQVIAPLASLVNHECDPNVRKVFTYNKKVMFYAIKAIEKHSQIFDCYYNYAYLQCCDMSERQKFLRTNYDLDCNCDACQRLEDIWYPVSRGDAWDFFSNCETSMKESKILSQYFHFINLIDEESVRLNENVKASLAEAVLELDDSKIGVTSKVRAKIVYTLMKYFEQKYGYRQVGKPYDLDEVQC